VGGWRTAACWAARVCICTNYFLPVWDREYIVVQILKYFPFRNLVKDFTSILKSTNDTGTKAVVKSNI
jgi:hypothetical protein